MVLLKSIIPTTLGLLDGPMITQERRTYLGMSGVGHSCLRYLWYEFRWAFNDSYSSRIKRLFNRGHREEAAIIKELRDIGYKISGRQLEFVGGFGHMKGHCDGIVEGVVEAPKTPHILELKTLADKYFKDLIKSGVRISKPVYYAQAQMYMHYGKKKRTLFIGVNKNNDAYYVERIRLDKDTVLKLKFRAKGVILADCPPQRPFSPTWYECKWCSANKICHHNKPMAKHCRTCTSVEPAQGGLWTCRNERNLSKREQMKGCGLYQAIPNI